MFAFIVDEQLITMHNGDSSTDEDDDMERENSGFADLF